MIIVNSVVFKTLAYVPVLAGLAAAVYALENYQLTFCHKFLRERLSVYIWLKTSPIFSCIIRSA